MKSFCSFLTVVLGLVGLVPNSHAGLIVLGNLPAANDSFGATVASGTEAVPTNFRNIRQAISFTTPAQSYPVGSVALRLQEYNTTDDVAAVGFFEDNGNDLPGALYGGMFINPSSNSDTVGQFIFTPTSPLTLAASTKYWLVLNAVDGWYQWHGSNPPITPTSQVGAIYGKMIGISEGEPRDIEGRIPSFQIATGIIPEPSTGPLLLTVLCCLSIMCRRTYGITW